MTRSKANGIDIVTCFNNLTMFTGSCFLNDFCCFLKYFLLFFKRFQTAMQFAKDGKCTSAILFYIELGSLNNFVTPKSMLQEYQKCLSMSIAFILQQRLLVDVVVYLLFSSKFFIKEF